MIEDLLILLRQFSTSLHELEAKYPEDDFPESIDHIWVDVNDTIDDLQLVTTPS